MAGQPAPSLASCATRGPETSGGQDAPFSDSGGRDSHVVQDWERVSQLFEAARVLHPSARSTFLDAVSASEPGLRRQIDSLLAADVVEDDFLSRPPAVLGAALRHAMDPLLPGAILKDRYVVQERVGAGGQALVYRAEDRLLSRHVVIKVMRAAYHENIALKARFESEMTALSRIDHPSVVGILDVGALADGSPYLVLQFIDGVSVGDLLREGAIEPARAVRIIQAIAAGLSAAHAAGVAHHDLKPDNVMVQSSSDGVDLVKIIDFGIAKIDRTALVPSMTTITVAGTIRYMAPEQFEGRNEPASDVYALGKLACELLFGHPDLQAVDTAVDTRIAQLLRAATAFHPHVRPTDLRAWSAQLADAIARPSRLRRTLMRSALLMIALVSTAVASAAWLGNRTAEERIVEKVGAFDPLEEGFALHGAVRGTVVQSPARTALIGWSVATHDPGGGYYYRRLSASQMRRALDRGWTLTATVRPLEGGASANVDFAGLGNRFDLNVFAEGDAHLVRLNTQLVPTFEGLELRLPATADHRKFELRWDPGLQGVDLWVDGEKRLSGYRGHGQFQEGGRVMFGAAPYKSERGHGSFLGVRFEINP